MADKLKPILGNSAQLQKTLEQEKEYKQRKALKKWQLIFVLALIVSIGSAGYFYAQLSPSFTLMGQNTTVKLGLVNENLKSLQTKINKYRYLIAQTHLNNFSYLAEQYLNTSEKLTNPNLTASERAVLTAKLSEAQNQIIPVLTDLRKALLVDITYKTVTPEGQPELTAEELETQYQEALRAALEEEKANLIAASTDQSAPSDDGLKLIDNAIKLVGNKPLIGTIKGLQLENLKKQLDDYGASLDPALRKQIQEIFRKILSSTSSDIAEIASIKAARIKWSTLIKQIAEITKTVDSNFDTTTFRNDLIKYTNGVNYDSLQFDANTNKITVSGTTRTVDATNFALISTLIDAFNASPNFKDVEMRSFSKSGDDQQGYSANFSFSLALRSPDEAQTTAGKTFSLARESLKERIGFKRIKK